MMKNRKLFNERIARAQLILSRCNAAGVRSARWVLVWAQRQPAKGI